MLREMGSQCIGCPFTWPELEERTSDSISVEFTIRWHKHCILWLKVNCSPQSISPYFSSTQIISTNTTPPLTQILPTPPAHYPHTPPIKSPPPHFSHLHSPPPLVGPIVHLYFPFISTAVSCYLHQSHPSVCHYLHSSLPHQTPSTASHPVCRSFASFHSPTQLHLFCTCYLSSNPTVQTMGLDWKD